MKTASVLSVLLFFPLQVLADPPKDKGTPPKPFALHLAAAGWAKRVFRGVETYPYPSFIAGPSFVFYERWQIRGPSVSYESPRRQAFTYSAEVSLVDDSRPWIRFQNIDKNDIRFSRPGTYEFIGAGTSNYGDRLASSVGLKWSKDINEHWGQFIELSVGIPVYKFTKFLLEAGWADKAMNQYVYGTSDNSGVAMTGWSLQHANPFLLKGAMAILKLTGTSVHGRERLRSPLLRGQRENYNFSAVFVWSLSP